jgi:hypothetical protein
MIPVRTDQQPTSGIDIDQREGADNYLEDLETLHALLCPDHNRHTFTTMCGVTRCFYCNRVVG